MDTQTTEHFANIIALSKNLFEQTEYVIDATPQRSILRVQANYGEYRVFITELFTGQTRKYSYYLLRDNWVEAGFDNSPDPRAIRLRYGKISQPHAGELVPHLHRQDKTQLFLTEEMTFAAFVDWLDENIQPGE